MQQKKTISSASLAPLTGFAPQQHTHTDTVCPLSHPVFQVICLPLKPDKKLNFLTHRKVHCFSISPTLFQRHIMFPENGQGKFSHTLSCACTAVLQNRCQKLYRKLYAAGFCRKFEFSFCDACLYM